MRLRPLWIVTLAASLAACKGGKDDTAGADSDTADTVDTAETGDSETGETADTSPGWTSTEEWGHTVDTLGSAPNWVVAASDGGYFHVVAGTGFTVRKYDAAGVPVSGWGGTWTPPHSMTEWVYGRRQFAVAAAPDGGLYVGMVGGSQGGWNIQRLAADGSQTWAVELALGTNGAVHDIAVAPDGNLLVIGTPADATLTGTPNPCHLARFSPDGVLDEAFAVDLDTQRGNTALFSCSALAIDATGAAYVVGTVAGGTTTYGVRRIDPDGVLYTNTWTMGPWFDQQTVGGGQAIDLNGIEPGAFVAVGTEIVLLGHGIMADGGDPGWFLASDGLSGGPVQLGATTRGIAAIGRIGEQLVLARLPLTGIGTNASPGLTYFPGSPLESLAVDAQELSPVPGGMTLGLSPVAPAPDDRALIVWTTGTSQQQITQVHLVGEDTGGDTAGETGADTGSDTGGDTGADTGGETGGDTSGDTAADTGA